MILHLRSFLAGILIASGVVLTTGLAAQGSHDHADMAAMAAPELLPASTAHTFPELMANVDAVMHHAMAAAPRNGDADHDFASAMVPHHQGAIDMARVELLYGRDPVLRRMAQEIIVSQQQEIVVMQRRIDALNATHTKTSTKAP